MQSNETRLFSRIEVIAYCGLTILLAGGVALLLKQSPYWRPLKSALGFREQQRGVGWESKEQAARARLAYEDVLAKRGVPLTVEEQDTLMQSSHRLRVWSHTHWLGMRIQKNPWDLWMMQELIHEIQPDYIVETGTCWGGSALYFANMLENAGLHNSKVITVDITPMIQEVSKLPLWQRKVEFLHGSSTSPDIVTRIAGRVKGKKVLVALDSNHTRDHVFQELLCYGPLVNPGSYIVVEDTNLDGIPLGPAVDPYADIGPGPMTAVVQFLETPIGKGFEQDLTRESMALTFNPGGWLKKRRQ